MSDWRLHVWRVALIVLPLVAAGCAAGTAFRQGEAAFRAGNLDQAVDDYRRATQAAPDNLNYRIALERAQLAASRAHLDKARAFEQNDQLEAALGEYRQASEYDPSNRVASAKIVELDRTIRERVEAARPKPAIEQLRERARAASAPPTLLNFTTPLPRIRFNNTSLRDVLTLIADTTGINITYDRDVQDRAVTVQFDNLTLEQALNELMAMNQLSYKVINDRSIFVFPDTPAKHSQYDEQVIRTFYLSHADSTELAQLLSSIIRLPGLAIQPAIAPNKTANTLTIRGTTSMVEILGKIIEQNDKPRAEIVVDVEILEVDRNRAKQYGLNLSEYAAGAIFSPEVSPSATTTSSGTGAGTGTTPGSTGTGTGAGVTTTNNGSSTAPSQVKSPPPFNLNTISRGVTTADFYLAVPTAIVRFLESDTHNKIVAKPQLRGAEGTKLELKIGSQIPVVATSYTPIATGGAGVNPLSSYNYKDVGVVIDMTPTVSLDGDIRLDIQVEDNQQGPDVPVAGVTVPSFVQRSVTTRLRLRDGESNLLAGLLQQADQRTVTGFPGAIHVPFLSQVLSGNNIQTSQIEIVMLLTPHIIRTQELTETDLKPIYIGSQQNLGLGGPAPLIAQQPLEPAAPVAAAAPGVVPGAPAGVAPAAGATPGAPYAPPGTTTVPGTVGSPTPGSTATVVIPPPGSSPVPGTVVAPAPSPGQPAPGQPQTGAPNPVAPGAAPSPAEPAPAATAAAGAAANPASPDQPAATTQPTPPPPPSATTGLGSAQVSITPPSTPMRVGGGPYTLPISINDASRLTTIALTIIYDPSKLRVRAVEEGTFMRAGGAAVTFNQSVNGNRIDVQISRGADAIGATGTGFLTGLLFDAIAPGPVTMTMSGTATGPGGVAMGLRFSPVTFTIQ